MCYTHACRQHFGNNLGKQCDDIYDPFIMLSVQFNEVIFVTFVFWKQLSGEIINH